jgi:hypothetical protein
MSFDRDASYKTKCKKCFIAEKNEQLHALYKRIALLEDEIRVARGPFDRETLTKMIMLCHPDKHGNSKVSNEVTRKLLDMRKT